MKKNFIGVILCLCVFVPAFAEEVEVLQAESSNVKIQPRLGVNFGHYELENFLIQGGGKNGFIGPEAGINVAFKQGFFVDFLVNSIATKTFTADPSLIAARKLEDGWITEYAATAGVDVYKDNVYLIGGYRYAVYGDSPFGDEAATHEGPFVGVSFPNLKFSNSDEDLLSVSIAVQFPEIEVNNTSSGSSFTEEADSSANIKLSYHKKGSPHGIGLKYNTFGGNSFSEYVLTGNYTYTFGK